MSDAIQPSAIYRKGELTVEDYTEAIEFLSECRQQLIDKGLILNCPCGDACGQKCHHNPLVMARIGASAYLGPTWKCFFCGAFFTDEETARLHFGEEEDEMPACKMELKGGTQ